MFKKLTTLSIALLIPAMLFAYSPKKEALLVGVEKYQNGDRLPGITKDINRMKNLLESRGFHVHILLNQNATLSKVVHTLQSYRHLTANDSFFFYTSSHGTQVSDNNGDEKDGLDEAYVLYDINDNISNEQGLLIDDQLDNLLAQIPAKKVMVADTCHSGTMYKSFSRDAKSKSVHIASNFKFINKSSVLGSIQKPKNLVVFGAAEDQQTSVATSQGSLFTEAFSDTWESDPNISFKNMKRATTLHIKDICKDIPNIQPYKPTLYSTNQSFINEPMNNFLQVNITINPQKALVEAYLDSLMQQGSVGRLNLNTKNYYNKGDSIKLTIDTLGEEGHLYILTAKESENAIGVLYPNPYYQNHNERWRGAFTFPNSQTPFAFKADNKTHAVERTVVYAILSQQIIPELEVSRVGYNKFQSIFKDFKSQIHLKNELKDILIQRKNNHIAIAKHVFSVGI